MRQVAELRDRRIDPWTQFAVGTRVEVTRGFLKGASGAVVEFVTKDDPARCINGTALYDIEIGGRRYTFARHELRRQARGGGR